MGMPTQPQPNTVKMAEIELESAVHVAVELRQVREVGKDMLGPPHPEALSANVPLRAGGQDRGAKSRVAVLSAPHVGCSVKQKQFMFFWGVFGGFVLFW